VKENMFPKLLGTGVMFVATVTLMLIAFQSISQAQGPTGTATALPPTGANGANASVDVAFRADLPDLGEAPELTNQTWVNSEPLRLSALRGKVVLLNFWTFGCYNCKNVLPYVRQWHDAYKDQGLVSIGVHFPEFSYEANLDNLKNAAAQLGVTWSIAEDNDGATWRAYRQRYWPTIYLIDKQGHIRYKHIGEGAYAETERAIKDLLAETTEAELQARQAVQATLPAWSKLAFTDVQTGKPITIGQFAGETIVIEPFAAWCSKCAAQLQAVSALAPEFANKRIVYIALGIDPSEDIARLQQYAADKGYMGNARWIFAASSPELSLALIEQFGRSVSSAPNTPIIVISPTGKIAPLSTGVKSADDLRSFIQANQG